MYSAIPGEDNRQLGIGLWLKRITAHPWITALVIGACAYGLWPFFARGLDMAGGGYLTAIVIGVLMSEFLCRGISVAPVAPIKHIRREALILTGLFVLGLTCLIVMKFYIPQNGGGTGIKITKVIVGVVALACMFQIVQIAYLLWLKYSPSDLGVSFNKAWLGIVLIPVMGLCAYLFAPEKILWGFAFKEMGFVGLILQGAILAAFVEEFMRHTVQTRIGAAMGSVATGWFVAAILWCFAHAPINAQQAGINFGWQSFAGTLGILPLGLFWGYLSLRTGSIAPAFILHATNLWGLQNLTGPGLSH